MPRFTAIISLDAGARTPSVISYRHFVTYTPRGCQTATRYKRSSSTPEGTDGSLHLPPAYTDRGYRSAGFPESERADHFPMFAELTPALQNEVALSDPQQVVS
jgi:hypothetical protein